MPLNSFVYLEDPVTVRLSLKSKRDHLLMLPQIQAGPDSQATSCGVSGIVWDKKWVIDVLLPGTVVTACRRLTLPHWQCNSPKLGPGPKRASHWFSSDQVTTSGLRDWAIWTPTPPRSHLVQRGRGEAKQGGSLL